MILKWKRVHNIDELKIGDIIRLNPECIIYMPTPYNKNICVKISNIHSSSTRDQTYPYLIRYDFIINYSNNKITEKNKPNEDEVISFTDDMLYMQSYERSWFEKLIIKGKAKTLGDEIDLLIDCIFR